MSRATLKWEVAVTVDVEVTDRATALTLLDDELREAVFAAAYDTVAPVLITVTPVPEDQEFEESFTVIGFWDEDEPVVTGVITGQHSVEGGMVSVNKGLGLFGLTPSMQRPLQPSQSRRCWKRSVVAMSKHRCTASCWAYMLRFGEDENTVDCDPFEARTAAEQDVQ